MLPNPYTPGETPRVLAGRGVERDQIKDRLARVATYGEMGGPLLLFHAPRGLGKTSLLREARTDAERAGFVTAWSAASTDRSLVAELGQNIERGLQRADLLPRAGRWRDRFEKVSIEFGMPGAKVSAELSGGSSNLTGAMAAIEDLLHETAILVREEGRAGFALFLDELQSAPKEDLTTLLHCVQNLLGDRAVNPLAFIGAGLPSIPEVVTAAATFGERSTFVELRPLDQTAADLALRAPAAQLGVRWAEDAAQLVIGQAQGYPYTLQLIGDSVWHHAAPSQEGTVITVDNVRNGLDRAAGQLKAMFRARWMQGTPGEQALMIAMARAGESAVPRAAIAELLGQDSRALSAPRDRLIDKGVIESAGHGSLRFTIPGFREYLLALTGEPDHQEP